MTRRAWGVVAAAGVVAVTAAALLAGAGRSRNAGGSGLLLGRAAGAVALASARMKGWRRPIRCLRDPAAGVPDVVVAGNRTFHRDGARLVGGNSDGRVKLGVLADARGAEGATLANLAWARRRLEAEKVDAVLVLGGMGRAKDELAKTLGAVASGAPWIVVAQAGEREGVPALAEALEALVAAGAPIVDGGAARILVVDGVAIGFLPGLAADDSGRAHGLAAGEDGCGRADEDTSALAGELAAQKAPRLLASYAPPRQRGTGATDLALGGVHVGDPTVARAAEVAGVVAVVHGQIDETAGRSAGTAGRSEGGWLAASAGAIDAVPAPLQGRSIATGGLLIVEISGNRATFRRLAADHKAGARR